MWTYIRGIGTKGNWYNNRALFLDSANDYGSLGNSDFYNVGTGPFTFALRVMRYDNGSSSRTALTLFRSAMTTSVSRVVLNLNTSYNSGTTDTLSFSLTNITDGVTKQDNIYVPSSYFPMGEWTTIVVGRTGTNYQDTSGADYANSIRNPANFFFYVNGVKLTPTVSMADPLGLQYQLDNTEAFTIGQGNLSTFSGMYFDYFVYYSRALSADEISAMSAGTFTVVGAKGIFQFNGSMVDDSSVGNDMQLVNSTTAAYITYPKALGTLVFLAGTANQVKSIAFPEAVTITNAYKNTSYGYGYSLDGGTTWSSLNATTTNGAVNISVPAGTTLLVRDATSRSGVGRVHLTF